MSERTWLASRPSTDVPSIFKKSLSATPEVNTGTLVLDMPTVFVAASPKPKLPLDVEADATSLKLLDANKSPPPPPPPPEVASCMLGVKNQLTASDCSVATCNILLCAKYCALLFNSLILFNLLK